MSLDQPSVTIKVGDQIVELLIDHLCDVDPTPNSTQSSYQALFFDLARINGRPVETSAAFSVVLSPSQPAEVLIEPTFDSPTHCGFLIDNFDPSSGVFAIEEIASETNNQHDSDLGDAEIEDMESPAPHKDLRKRLQDQKKLMRQITMECQKKLLDDLEACHHNISCSGKAICRHLHKAIRNLLSNIRSLLHDSAMVSQDRQQYQELVLDEKNVNATSAFPQSSSKGGLDPTNPVIIALEILFSVLGLGAFYAIIRRRCCSLRYRVERLANREERQRARHYRQLARKEAIRKKWVAVKSVFSRLPCPNSNYEEKRALILEAAAQPAVDMHEQDLERGGPSTDICQHLAVARISEEITDLRYAHEIVTALLQAGQGVAPIEPGTTAIYVHDTRSRSSSLPSYNSANLPDYTSQPENSSDSGSDVIIIRGGFRPSSPSSSNGASILTGVTPESSIPDLSPRCSGETLRTDFSRGY